jgi:DNA ligase-1
MVEGTFQNCQSRVMTRSGMPKFTYHVFDYCPDDAWAREPYYLRLAKLYDLVTVLRKEFDWLVFVKQEELSDREALDTLESKAIAGGYEGLILRSKTGHYKYGRSTFNEHLLLKIKRFEDREAVIVDCVQRFRNKNEPTRNELGYQERSSHQENMVPDDALGALVVEDLKFPGVQFQIGSGFTESERQMLWKFRETLLRPGRLVKYKYQPHGTADRPRTPIFICFRDEADLS